MPQRPQSGCRRIVLPAAAGGTRVAGKPPLLHRQLRHPPHSPPLASPPFCVRVLSEYAQVLRMLGNGRLEAHCMDGIKRLCHIRGKMRKKVRGAAQHGAPLRWQWDPL